MSTFIDAGVFFAAARAGDKAHSDAVRLLASIERGVTTDHVVVESWGLLQRKVGHNAAMSFWNGLRYAPLFIELVTPADLERAESISERWSDQRFSIVDCTSFAVMERIGCSKAASFDSDFAVYRFGPDGKRAFEILR